MQGIALTPAGNGEQLLLSTDRGDLVGTWRGETAVDVNDKVSVELDVLREYDVSEFEKVSGDPDRFEPLPAGATTIAGRLEEVESQAVLVLRVGGTFLSFEVKGQLPNDLTGATVRVVVEDLQLYPTGI